MHRITVGFETRQSCVCRGPPVPLPIDAHRFCVPLCIPWRRLALCRGCLEVREGLSRAIPLSGVVVALAGPPVLNVGMRARMQTTSNV